MGDNSKTKKMGKGGKSLQDIEAFIEQTKSLLGEDAKVFENIAETSKQSLWVDPKSRIEDLIEVAADGLPSKQGLAGKSRIAGINRMVAQLRQVKSAPPPDKDESAQYYTFDLVGMTLAVRKDGIRVYLKLDPVMEVDYEQILAFFKAFDIDKFDIQALKKEPKSEQWILLAEGREPIPCKPERVELLNPRHPEQVVSISQLKKHSIALYEYFQHDNLENVQYSNLKVLVATPGDVVARIVKAEEGKPGHDVFGDEIPSTPPSPTRTLNAGEHVVLNSRQLYIAKRYGYVCLINKQISVISPIWVCSKKMQSYWAILGRHPKSFLSKMIKPWLEEKKVVHGVNHEKINAVTARIRSGKFSKGIILIAAGTPAKDGTDSIVETFIDQAFKSGIHRDDGSIDFRQVNFIHNVQADQVIAKHIPPTPGVAGKDLSGRVLEAVDGKKLFEAGENVVVRTEGGVEFYHAGINGMFSQSGIKVSVLQLLAIEGDANYSTGNINFTGDVYIKGSVKTGFSVKATGNVIVGEGVEFGAFVVALGDVIVGKGILGKNTRVVAQGSVRAQFVQEAAVIAQNDITLGNSSYHSYLRSGNRVRVEKSKGARGGSIIGGQTWALEAIDVHIAGSYTGTPTTLVVGVDSEQVHKLEELEEGIEECNHHIKTILHRVGINDLDLVQIKEVIATSPSHQRKNLVQQIGVLDKLVQAYQMLLKDRRKLRDEMEVASDYAKISVQEIAYPGVVVRIGNTQLQLQDEVRIPNFQLENGRLIVG